MDFKIISNGFIEADFTQRIGIISCLFFIVFSKVWIIKKGANAKWVVALLSAILGYTFGVTLIAMQMAYPLGDFELLSEQVAWFMGALIVGDLLSIAMVLPFSNVIRGFMSVALHNLFIATCLLTVYVYIRFGL
jgi:hypothetical protein